MPGEIVAIVGDNGAGQVHLRQDPLRGTTGHRGTISIAGREATFDRPSDAREAGIETVYQDLSLADHLDVLSNLFLGREEYYFKLRRARRPQPARNGVTRRTLLGEIGVNVPGVHDIVSGLSGGQRQGVAIARAAGWGSQLIIMDEPTAALGVQETAHVHDIIRGAEEPGRRRASGQSQHETGAWN